MPSNEDQFQKVYFDNYSVAVRTGIYIVKDAATAEDIAQNVFLKLWNKPEKLAEVKNIKSYIIQMSRNEALDYLKQNSDVFEQSISLEFEESSDIDNSDEMRLAVEKAIIQLAPQCRLIFSLSRFEGLTNQEIAEHLSISIRTVETQISAALKKFRTDLRHYFIEFLGLCFLMSEFFFQCYLDVARTQPSLIFFIFFNSLYVFLF